MPSKSSTTIINGIKIEKVRKEIQFVQLNSTVDKMGKKMEKMKLNQIQVITIFNFDK